MKLHIFIIILSLFGTAFAVNETLNNTAENQTIIEYSYDIQSDLEIPYTYTFNLNPSTSHPDSGGTELNDNVICHDYQTGACAFMWIDLDVITYIHLTDINKKVKGYEFYFGGTSAGNYAPGQVKIYGSMDNISWILMDDTTYPVGSMANIDVDSLTFSNEVAYEYWKIESFYSSDRRWMAFREFNLIKGNEDWDFSNLLTKNQAQTIILETFNTNLTNPTIEYNQSLFIEYQNLSIKEKVFPYYISYQNKRYAIDYGNEPYTNIQSIRNTLNILEVGETTEEDLRIELSNLIQNSLN